MCTLITERFLYGQHICLWKKENTRLVSERILTFVETTSRKKWTVKRRAWSINCVLPRKFGALERLLVRILVTFSNSFHSVIDNFELTRIVDYSSEFNTLLSMTPLSWTPQQQWHFWVWLSVVIKWSPEFDPTLSTTLWVRLVNVNQSQIWLCVVNDISKFDSASSRLLLSLTLYCQCTSEWDSALSLTFLSETLPPPNEICNVMTALSENLPFECISVIPLSETLLCQRHLWGRLGFVRDTN
jgi:hypothetical protein